MSVNTRHGHSEDDDLGDGPVTNRHIYNMLSRHMLVDEMTFKDLEKRLTKIEGYIKVGVMAAMGSLGLAILQLVITRPGA